MGAVGAADLDLSLSLGNPKLLSALGTAEEGMGLLLFLPSLLSQLFPFPLLLFLPFPSFLLLLGLCAEKVQEDLVFMSSLSYIRGKGAENAKNKEYSSQEKENSLDIFFIKYGSGEKNYHRDDHQCYGKLVCSISSTEERFSVIVHEKKINL